MNGWEIDDLIGALKAVIKDNDATLKQFCADYHPLCAMTGDTLVMLRRFEVVNRQDERRILNAKPKKADNSQWGITIVNYDGSSGSMFSVCVPNELDYQSIELDDKGQVVLAFPDQNVTTNVNELANKLNRIYGLATEVEIAASFDSLNNESYLPPETPKVIHQTLTNDILGTLTYRQERKQYETTYSINGNDVFIFIELVEEKRLNALVDEVAKKLASEYYLQAMQAMLIPMLTLKNDYWLGEDEQGELEPILTIEEFSERITLTGIEFYADGSSVIYCDDGELFFGHCIMIDINKDGEFIDANIAG